MPQSPYYLFRFNGIHNQPVDILGSKKITQVQTGIPSGYIENPVDKNRVTFYFQTQPLTSGRNRPVSLECSFINHPETREVVRCQYTSFFAAIATLFSISSPKR
jgi:hypothetical protein